jgi:hypothetical protein
MECAACCRTAEHEGEGEGSAAVQLQVEAMAAFILLLTNAVCCKYAQRK